MKNNISLLNLIKYPLLSKKTKLLLKKNIYTFIVDIKLTKLQIKFIFEIIFKVKILKINTCILPIFKKKIGKNIGIKPQYKKVYLKVNTNNLINL